jgi:hypothetical protein
MGQALVGMGFVDRDGATLDGLDLVWDKPLLMGQTLCGHIADGS